MHDQDPEYLGYHPGAELVIAIVCPLGTPYSRVVDTLTNYLRQFNYKAKAIRLSEYFDDLLVQLGVNVESGGESPSDVAAHKIAAGNMIRDKTKKNDIMALVAAGAIADFRMEEHKRQGRKQRATRSIPLSNTAFIVTTVRRPEEVTTLRRI